MHVENLLEYLQSGRSKMSIWRMRMQNIDALKDTVMGTPLITIVGNSEIHIENFKSIVEYDCDMLKMLTKKGMITIYGKCLEIKYYDGEEIAVKGKLEKIEL